MINTDRIVPVTATDLITLYGTIMKLAGTTVTFVSTPATDGEFQIAAASGNLLLNEPMKKLTFGPSMTSATVYFVPAYNYEGFAKDEATLTVTGEVEADGKTLYKAELSTNAITITKAGF